MSMLLATLLTGLAVQAPTADEWLDDVPAGTHVVVHARALEPVADDLVAMVSAMSETLGQQIKPSVDAFTQQIRTQFNVQMVPPNTPVLALVMLPEFGPNGPGAPQIAVLLRSNNYDGLRAALSGQPARGDAGQIQEFPMGAQSAFGIAKDDYVALSNDQALLQSLGNGESLADVLDPEAREKLFSDDLGIYANLALVQENYEQLLRDGFDGFLNLMDMAIQQGQNAQQIEAAKTMYRGLFDRFFDTQILTLSVDFDAARLSMDGLLTARDDSKLAQTFAAGSPASTTLLSQLPTGRAYYFFAHANPELMEQLTKLGQSMAGQFGPAMMNVEAMEAINKAGLIETAGGISFTSNGFEQFTVSDYRDDAGALAATKAMYDGFEDQPMFKEATIEENALEYGGFTLDRNTLVWDFQAMMAMQPNANAPGVDVKGMLESLLGEKMTVYNGSDGRVLLNVTGNDVDRVKAAIDAYKSGQNSLAQSRGFAELRDQLPERVNLAFAVDPVGLAKQLALQFSGLFGDRADGMGARLADVPEGEVYFGGSTVTGPNRVGFQFVVPSRVGRIIEQEIVPIFAQLANPQGN